MRSVMYKCALRDFAMSGKRKNERLCHSENAVKRAREHKERPLGSGSGLNDLDGVERYTLSLQGSKEGLLPLPRGECLRSKLRSSVLRLAGVWGGKPHAIFACMNTLYFLQKIFIASIGKCAPTAPLVRTYPKTSFAPQGKGRCPCTPQGTSPLTRYHSPWGKGADVICPLWGVVSVRVTLSRVKINGLRPPLTPFPLQDIEIPLQAF